MNCANCRHSAEDHGYSRACRSRGCICPRYLAPERLPFEIGDRVRFKAKDGIVTGLVVDDLKVFSPNSGARWYRVTARGANARIEAASEHFELETP